MKFFLSPSYSFKNSLTFADSVSRISIFTVNDGWTPVFAIPFLSAIFSKNRSSQYILPPKLSVKAVYSSTDTGISSRYFSVASISFVLPVITETAAFSCATVRMNASSNSFNSSPLAPSTSALYSGVILSRSATNIGEPGTKFLFRFLKRSSFFAFALSYLLLYVSMHTLAIANTFNSSFFMLLPRFFFNFSSNKKLPLLAFLAKNSPCSLRFSF